MPKVPLSHKIPLSPAWRRALEVLAERRCTAGTVLLAHGFTPEMLESLVLSGLATTNADMLQAGDETIADVQMRLTDAGWRVLRSQPQHVPQRSDFDRLN